MSGSVPPNIAEFPDHYFRNDDIIRPKPRRLVDMRRSAIGGGGGGGGDYTLPQLSPGCGGGGGGESSHSSMSTFSPMSSSSPSLGGGGSGGGTSSLQISPVERISGVGPPSLPAKPPPSLSSSPTKPLPPRPSSTSHLQGGPGGVGGGHLLKPIPMTMMDSGQYVAPNPRNSHTSTTTQPPIPNLPQLTGLGMLVGGQRSQQPFNGAASATDHTLLQRQQNQNFQKRLFLSPQPHQSRFGTFQSPPGQGQPHNLSFATSTSTPNSTPFGENVPYYAELTSPPLPNSGSPPGRSLSSSGNPGFLPAPFPQPLQNHQSHLMELKQRVQRAEWKSADSLQNLHNQQNLHQQYYFHQQNADFIAVGGGQGQGGGHGDNLKWNSPNSKSTGKINLTTFESKLSLPPPQVPSPMVSGGASLLRKSVPPPEALPVPVAQLPAKSPEYDQIKSPSEIAKERLEAMLQAKIGALHSSSAAPENLNKVNHNQLIKSDNDKSDSTTVKVAVAVADDFSLKLSHNSENENVINNLILNGENETVISGTVVKNNKFECNNSVNLNNSLNNGGGLGGGAESTDCSSLGRSSTSDGDFGTLGGGGGSGGGGGGSSGSGTFNMYTAHAGSTPSARKGRHSAPSSKVKSRRRNILQHLSVDEMHLLNGGLNLNSVNVNGVVNGVNSNNNNNNNNNGRCTSSTANAGNTGTGGSSSDGSSGHASMSDSQTSGSPPAEYARIIGGGGVSGTGCLNNVNNVSSNNCNLQSGGYKSVLKSVPEDDSSPSATITNLTGVGLGGGSARLDSTGSANRSFGSSGSSSGKKSSRSRHRNSKQLENSLLLSNGNHGLEDIKQAIEQLTLRSSSGGSAASGGGTSGAFMLGGSGSGGHPLLGGGLGVGSGGHGGHGGGGGHHSSYSTSTYSSMSGSECDRQHRSRPHHLIRHSSLETINTQVTSADEFVWVDSHNRLVELQQFPWSNHDILKVIEKSSRLKDSLERISMETIPRISYLLQRALVRIARETQRLSKTCGFCSKVEVASALKIVLAPSIADSCSKACLRAAAMFAVTTKDPLHRESKSARAGLHLHVGRFQRWMVEVRLGRFVHEFAAIYLAAIVENLIEVILCQALNYVATSYLEGGGAGGGGAGVGGGAAPVVALNNNGHPVLMAASMEQSIAGNGDLWGLLQPYAHLNAGRTASGALALPRWSSVLSMDSSGSSSSGSGTIAGVGSASNSSGSGSGNSQDDSCATATNSHSNSQSRLITTRSPPPLLQQNSTTSTSTTSSHHQQQSHHQHNKSLEQSLLTTCVGSIGELADLVARVTHYHHKQLPLGTSNGSKSMPASWSPSAIHTLFYFMRCSQLETQDEHKGKSPSSRHGNVNMMREDREQERLKGQGSGGGVGGGGGGQGHHQQPLSKVPVQELVYERPFIVLPPLIEWVRVAAAHADHRHSGLVDKDDVMQAARLLLPGIDCPVRLIGTDEFSWPRRSMDEFECNRRLKIDLAFKMLTSGRSDLVAQALLLMPPSKANTFNELGLSPLIMACIRGEENMVRVLLDAGADSDIETPPNCPNFPQANNETQHWTALTFACLMGHTPIIKTLLEKGCNVEGGAKLSEDKSTQTPLQMAAATGNMEVVSILLSYGANPFLNTLVRDSLCYTGSAQRGSFSGLSVAASHGHRSIVHKLLSHPYNQSPSKEVLSLEEILAEGLQAQQARSGQLPAAPSSGNLTGSGGGSGGGSSVGGCQGSQSLLSTEESKLLTKNQTKILQEAMYQSSENGHLEITLDLRNVGIPWTLHCWVNALSTAHELRCEPIVDQLLQDCLQILPMEDASQGHFVEDCLPLLFAIFRNSKNEGTTLLLADIFQTCYGRESIKEIRDTCLSNGTRIDPKYVNNPELSDVQFRVEGRVFYAHKIVLVTSSPRFKSMLKSAPESNSTPVLQINDIRYRIFQMVMEYLYNGGCDVIRHIDSEDILELMAAANFFQLDGLLHFCEARCSQMVNTESIVSLYIHAKVYNAVQLLEYCQGFLLQNMVALLTYDDSVRRLIFGKKLHNHDVLAGLLLTLQARLKSRPNRKSK